jgi:hypothetical protein
MRAAISTVDAADQMEPGRYLASVDARHARNRLR